MITILRIVNFPTILSMYILTLTRPPCRKISSYNSSSRLRTLFLLPEGVHLLTGASTVILIQTKLNYFELCLLTVLSLLSFQGSVIVSTDRTHDVFGIHSSCHLFNKTLRAHWYGFNDQESGISGFRVAVGKKPNTADVLPFQEVGVTTNVTLPLNNASALFDGDIVYVTVEAHNPAKLVTHSTSPPTRLISADSNAYLVEGDFYCYNV